MTGAVFRLLIFSRPFRTLFSLVFSFEMLFVLFLFAGRYKADPRFSWFPVDLTLFFFMMSVLTGLFLFIRRKCTIQRRAFNLFSIILTFIAYVTLSLIWTLQNPYAYEKALYILTLTLWPFIACAFIIAYDERRIRRFFLLIILFSLWIAIESTMAYFSSDNRSFVTALGGNYLGLGRVIGIGALIILGYILFHKQHIALKTVLLSMFGYYLFLLLIIGGRAPFLATLFGSLFPLMFGIRLSVFKGITVKRYFFVAGMIVAISIGFIAYLFSTGNLTSTLTRILVLFQPGFGDSAGSRMGYYTSAVEFWMSNPVFGYGIGSWPVLAGFVSKYPHNIFLEILVELGLVGFVLFIFLLFRSLQFLGLFGAIQIHPVRMMILMLFMNVFFNALISGDIPDNRILFGVLGLMVFQIRSKTA